MVRDIFVTIEVVPVPTVREPDGLEISSRNRYLPPRHRPSAAALSKALDAGRAAAGSGAEAVVSCARAVLEAADGVAVDYVELTGPDLGQPPYQGEARLLVAARLGATRLIDNIAIDLTSPSLSQ